MTDAVEALLNEVRLTYHLAIDVADAIHAGEPVTTAQRAVLEYVYLNGREAVPTIARARGVSRQHIQTLVHGLLDLDLVALEENPAHRRSPLVRLTTAGKRQIERMRKREARFLAPIESGISQSRLRAATRALHDVRTALGVER